MKTLLDASDCVLEKGRDSRSKVASTQTWYSVPRACVVLGPKRKLDRNPLSTSNYRGTDWRIKLR